MACDLATTQADSCTSGIGKVTDEITLLQVIAQLACESESAATGATQILSGVGAPAADPGVSAAIYFDTATGDQYNWYSGAWH